MFSVCSRLAAGAAALLLAACDTPGAPESGTFARPVLTVCADPNNLPFSNRQGEGFENRIAQVIAADLGLPLQYHWWPQRRGFARHTLATGACDLIAGVQAGYEMARTTQPYYVSSYVFVTRADLSPAIESFDDPRLRTLRIGIHAVGDDYSSVPPALALAARGIVGNLHGYSIHGNYAEPDPPARLIEAVTSGQIDVAIAWGPLAGFFAGRSPVALRLFPVPETEDARVPMQFAIAMAVRRDDAMLHTRVNESLQRRAPQIAAILQEYQVPFAPPGAPLLAGAPP